MRTDFDQWALGLAKEVSSRSTCLRRHAGAVAVDVHRRVIGIGYNGVPRNFIHCTAETPCPGALDPSGHTENCMAVHAEINCIINSGDSFRVHTMYVTAAPCFKCALVLANLPGLERVVYIDDYPDNRGYAVLSAADIITQKLNS